MDYVAAIVAMTLRSCRCPILFARVPRVLYSPIQVAILQYFYHTTCAQYRLTCVQITIATTPDFALIVAI
jgi:hypothetical protein